MGHSGGELWVFLTLAVIVWYNSVLTLGEEMENIDYETLHKYSQQVYKAKFYVSPVTGEEVDFSAYEKIIYLTLLNDLFASGGEIAIGQDKLAEMIGFNRKTVISKLKSLRENGVIDCEKRVSSSRGFSYWVYLGVQFPLELSTKEGTKSKSLNRKKIPPRVRFEVLRRNKFCCSYCGKAAVDGYRLVIDHIKPVSKGGTNDIDNLTASCDDCNNGKGTADIDSYTTPVFP